MLVGHHGGWRVVDQFSWAALTFFRYNGLPPRQNQRRIRAAAGHKPPRYVAHAKIIILKVASSTQLTFSSGHFYLFHLVKAALLASASPSFNARVVSVSSAAHRRSTIQLNDLHFEHTAYDPLVAYGQSKLANIHFANELDRRYQAQHLRAVSLHPGGIVTPLARYLAQGTADVTADPDISKIMKSPGQGAATSVWAAVAQELEGRGALYLDDVAEAEPTPPDAPYWAGGYGAPAFDPQTEEKLWDASLKLTGVSE